MSRTRKRPKRDRVPWWGSAYSRGILVAVAIVAVVVAVRVAASDGESAPPTGSEQTLELGASLYADTCASCHGASGEGFVQQGVPAPPLDGSAHSWHHPDEQIIGLLRQGGNQMPAVGRQWGDEEIEAVLAHVKNWWAPWQRDNQPGALGE